MPVHRYFCPRKNQPPPYEYCGRTHFEDCFRPRFDYAVSEYAESQQPADADSYCFHRRAPAEPDRGISTTSSIQAVPRILLPSFSLGVLRRTSCRSFVSGPVVNSVSSSVHSWVPARFAVKRAGFPGRETSRISNRIPLSVLKFSVRKKALKR